MAHKRGGKKTCAEQALATTKKVKVDSVVPSGIVPMTVTVSGVVIEPTPVVRGVKRIKFNSVSIVIFKSRKLMLGLLIW